MPAYGPWRGPIGGPVRPNFTNNNPRPSRGGRHQDLPGAASLGWLPRSGDIYARCTSRGSNDTSHADQGQACASGRSVPVSSFVRRRQAQAQGPEESSKGFCFGATRPRPPGRQDGGHRGAHDGVTTGAFGRRRPSFVRITSTSCPPSNWPLWDPFPPNIWEEDQGLYK